MLVKITAKRQVTFPARVLDALGVKPGDQLELEEGPDGFILRPRRIDPTRLAPLRGKLRRGVCPFCEKAKTAPGDTACCCHDCFVSGLEEGRREIAKRCTLCPLDWTHYVAQGLRRCSRGDHQVSCSSTSMMGARGSCYYCGQEFFLARSWLPIPYDVSEASRLLKERAKSNRKTFAELVDYNVGDDLDLSPRHQWTDIDYDELRKLG